MAECEEVAASMLPTYLEWNSTLPDMKQAHSMAKIRNWVQTQMRAFESYTVMDNVTEALIELVMPNRQRSDGKLAHAWVKGAYVGFDVRSILHTMDVCIDCGVLKGPPEHPETPCKGKVKVTLR